MKCFPINPGLVASGTLERNVVFDVVGLTQLVWCKVHSTLGPLGDYCGLGCCGSDPAWRQYGPVGSLGNIVREATNTYEPPLIGQE